MWTPSDKQNVFEVLERVELGCSHAKAQTSSEASTPDQVAMMMFHLCEELEHALYALEARLVVVGHA